MSKFRTSIATSDKTSITIRGFDLVDDLMGKRSFAEMIYYHLVERFPSKEELYLLDACLVTLMEHGVTPSSLVSRLVIDSVPGQLQVAVAAGLTTVGDVFVGTMEGCGKILADGVASSVDPDEYCTRIVDEFAKAKRPLPGFGHPFHKPDDPRTPKLLELAKSVSKFGRYCELLEKLGKAADARLGRHITINATGGIAALLLEAGLSPDIFRGIAVISRSAGLVTHIREEKDKPTARGMWDLVSDHTEFESPR